MEYEKEESMELSPEQEKDKYYAEEQRKWINELGMAKKEFTQWHERARKVNEIYLDKRPDAEKDAHKFNLFYSNTKILTDALYARIPKPDVTRRFKDPTDQLGRISSNIIQRSLFTELENDGYFTSTAKDIIKDYCISGAGVAWVRYVPKITKPESEDEKPASPQLTNNEDAELAEKPGASPIITDEDTPIDHVLWSDVLWSPTRTWKECRWIARCVYMDKEEVEKRFGEAWANELLIDVDSETEQEPTFLSTNELEPKNKPDNTVKVWEIWCKTSKKVYFVCEKADSVLDILDDPFGLPHFFPTAKPLLGATTTSNMVPEPDYTLVQDQYTELNTLNSRISNLVRACKVAGAYDKSAKEIGQILSPNSPETMLVPVDKWDMFAEKGGLQGSITFMPIQEVATVIGLLQVAAERIKQQIYELTGISDIIRGQTNPYETASAQGIKAQYASLRLQTRQTEVAEFIAEILRIKAFLMVKFYDEKTLLEKAGPMLPSDMALAPQAIALLKNERLANTRIEVSVDSLQLANWEQDRRDRNEAISALANLLREAIPAYQQNPELGPMFLNLIKFQLSSYRGAKDIEGYIDEQLQLALTENKDKPKEPDPAQQAAEIAAKQKEMEINANVEIEKAKADAEIQKSTNELEFKREAKTADVAIEKEKLEIERAKLRIEELKLTKEGLDTSELNLPVGDGVQSTRLTKGEMLAAMQMMQEQNMVAMQTMMQQFMSAIDQLANTPTAPATYKMVRDPVTGVTTAVMQ